MKKKILKKQIKNNYNIKKLKEKLFNNENDRQNIIQFNKRINNLISSDKDYSNDKVFENTVTDNLYRKYELKKLNFPFFNYVKSTKEERFVSLMNYQIVTILHQKKDKNQMNKENEYKENGNDKEIEINKTNENNKQNQKDEEIESKEFIFFNDWEYFLLHLIMKIRNCFFF
jgi:hypothetical protein